ncbi:hypothetical protein PR002_g2754 [Phytophthora rubi]|uniref:Uncharacterized protein n=1 Tax=Phytophthora rubi TaxID=129364 RepID=A0A6A3NMK2_9STRA|nr:hypothetical protein PR002_g2754 [Phytophthora rubi]
MRERPLHEQQRVLAKPRLHARAGGVEQVLRQLLRVALDLRSAAVQCSSAVDAVADEFQRAQEAASSWRRAAAVRVGAERAPAEMSASAEKSVPARSLTTDVATGAWRRGSVTGAGAPRRVATKGEWLVIVRK